MLRITKKRRSYGSLRVHALLNQQGIRCGHNRVARLMRIAGVRATAQRRRFRYPAIAQTEAKIFPNLVNRQFTVPAPNTVWLTDITFINTRSQPMYLATVLDLYSRRIVGWALDLTRSKIAETALQRAILLRNPAPGFIVHSDRGSEFTSIAYANVCANAPSAKVSVGSEIAGTTPRWNDFLPVSKRKWSQFQACRIASHMRQLRIISRRSRL
jgi:transposase InsO family protein